MNSTSFGAEGDNNMEILSVKILLKRAYSAHLAKVRSLECEVRELKEKLQISKTDKTECIQCKEMQKTLDSCKQEHAAALQDVKKKYECLAQKLALLESTKLSSTADENPSVKQDAMRKSPQLQSLNENTSGKQDATKKSPKLQLRSENISAKQDATRQSPKLPSHNENISAKPGATRQSPKLPSRNENISAKQGATRQSPKLLSRSENISAKQDATKKSPKLQSESSQRKQILTSINTNIALPGVNAADKKSNQSKVTRADNKITFPVEAATGVFEATKESKNKTSILSVNAKDFFSTLQESFWDDSRNDSDVVLVTETLDILDEVPDQNSDKKKLGAKDSANLNAKSTVPSDAGVEKENIFDGAKSSPSERRSSGKRCSTGSSNEDEQTTKKVKSTDPEEILTLSDEMFREINSQITNLFVLKASDTNISSSKGDPSDVSNVENLSSLNVNPSFFEVDSSFLELKSHPVLNNNKKSKALARALAVSHDDDADFQTSVGSVSKKESDESGPWKTSKKNSKKAAGVKNIKSTSRFKMTLESPRLSFKKPKYKQTKLSKSIFQSGNTSATDSVRSSERVNVGEDDGNSRSCSKENSDSKETEKEMDVPSESVTWDGGTLSFSEMERLKNMTIDMDVTFVPDLVLQSSNDSVPDVPGAWNVTKALLGQMADSECTGDECENNSPNLDDDKQKALHEEASRSCANQQPTVYRVEQYPEKNVPEPPLSKNGKQKYNSFDRVPSPEMPSYKFKEDPVRGKDKRQQLKGFDCKECEKYYSALGLSDKEKKERLKQCSRHRATYGPPATPEHFWELEFPDTQECKERGYLGDTQKVSLKSRRRYPLK